MSIPFKSVTAASIFFLCPLILTSSDAILVISPFFISSALNTSKEKFSSFVLIFSSLTSCLSILICVHPESTSAFNHNSFPFFILTFAHIFSFLSLLVH